MPAVESVRLGDSGFDIIATIEEAGSVVDVSTATSMKIYIKTPAGDVLEKTGSLYTDGTDGKIKWTADTTLLPIAQKKLIGGWAYEGKCTLGAWTGTSTSATFRVDDVLRRS